MSFEWELLRSLHQVIQKNVFCPIFHAHRTHTQTHTKHLYYIFAWAGDELSQCLCVRAQNALKRIYRKMTESMHGGDGRGIWKCEKHFPLWIQNMWNYIHWKLCAFSPSNYTNFSSVSLIRDVVYHIVCVCMRSSCLWRHSHQVSGLVSHLTLTKWSDHNISSCLRVWLIFFFCVYSRYGAIASATCSG